MTGPAMIGEKDSESQSCVRIIERKSAASLEVVDCRNRAIDAGTLVTDIQAESASVAST